jgi:uncharacterized protein YggU (UPF0235/DUF167 family)
MHSRPASSFVRLTVHVKPLRSQTELFCDPDGTLTMHLAAAPVKGKANREIVRWLSKRLRTSSSNVQLVAGFYSNVKVIEIIGMTDAAVAAALNIKCKSDAKR